jgi:hypothetical protein
MLLVFFFFALSRYLERSGPVRVLPEALVRHASSQLAVAVQAGPSREVQLAVAALRIILSNLGERNRRPGQESTFIQRHPSPM